MDNLSRIGFLKYALAGQLYVVGDTVFVFPARQPGLLCREIGSFKHHVRSYANLAARLPGLVCDTAVLSTASRFSSNLSEMRFCLTSLMECLKSRQTGGAKLVGQPPQVDQLLASLTRNVAALQNCTSSSKIESRIVSEVLKQIRPPCGIFSGAVVPIQEAPVSSRSLDRFSIDDKYYVHDLENSKPLASVCRAIRSRVGPNRPLRDGTRHRVATLAEAVVADATQLFAVYPSTERGGGRVIFADACHQLQHNSRGDFVLVRGPLKHRLSGAKLFVGLRIRGKTRRQMLSVLPAVAKKDTDFWTAKGRPVDESICMGSKRQYSHLFSRRFKDPEAIIQWLDAGVIVATSRPEYHLLWHNDCAGSGWQGQTI